MKKMKTVLSCLLVAVFMFAFTAVTNTSYGFVDPKAPTNSKQITASELDATNRVITPTLADARATKPNVKDLNAFKGATATTNSQASAGMAIGNAFDGGVGVNDARYATSWSVTETRPNPVYIEITLTEAVAIKTFKLYERVWNEDTRIANFTFSAVKSDNTLVPLVNAATSNPPIVGDVKLHVFEASQLVASNKFQVKLDLKEDGETPKDANIIEIEGIRNINIGTENVLRGATATTTDGAPTNGDPNKAFDGYDTMFASKQGTSNPSTATIVVKSKTAVALGKIVVHESLWYTNPTRFSTFSVNACQVDSAGAITTRTPIVSNAVFDRSFPAGITGMWRKTHNVNTSKLVVSQTFEVIYTYRGGGDNNPYIQELEGYDASTHLTLTKAATEGELPAGIAVNGAGNYVENEEVSLSATLPVGCGFTFDGWYRASELLSREQLYTHTLTADTALIGKFSKLDTVNVDIDKNTTDVAMNEPLPVVSTTSSSGYELHFVAPATTNSGKPFDGWYINSKLVSTALELVVGIDSKTIRVQAKYCLEANKVVLKRGEIVIETIYLNDANFATFDPSSKTPPQIFGYTVNGWSDVVLTDNGRTKTYTAKYAPVSTIVTVQVNGGIEETININSSYTLSSTRADFGYWKDFTNGTVLSYEPNYSFTARRNYKILEVQKGAEVYAPQITIDTSSNGAIVKENGHNKVYAYANIAIPTGYTAVESGFIGKYNATSTTAPADMFLQSAGVNVMRFNDANLRKLTGEFRLKTTTQNYAIRAYLIYKDSNNNLVTIYSQIITYSTIILG